MGITRPLTIIPLLCTLTLCGCASLLAPEDAGFEEVQRALSERTGNEVAWDRKVEDEGLLTAAVRSLLADELTVEEAVQITLLNNRRLQATYEDLGVARAELIQAGLLRNPIFEGSLRLHGGEDVLEFSVVQEFMSIFTIPLRRARAKAEFERAKIRVTGEVIDLAGRTRMAFYRFLAAQETLKLQRSISEAAEASYDAARRLHVAGNITDLALANEQALYEQTKFAVSGAELAAVEAREELNVLMGLFGHDTAWKAPDQFPAVPEDEEELPDLETRAITSSLDLAAARWQIESAAQRLGIAKARSILPEFGSGVKGERESEGTWFIGPLLEVAMPIFDWGQGSRERALAELRRAWREYTALAVEIRAAMRSAHYRMTTTRQQTLYYQKVLLPLSERITRETQLQFNAMQIGVFQLLAAKQRETAVRRQYIESLRDYWIARAQMAQILNGRLVGPSQGFMSGGDGH